MPSYLLVLEIEPMEVDRDYPMLPLHCTLMNWFSLSVPPPEFSQLLTKALRPFQPQKLLIGDEATFTGHTKSGPIPVTVNKVVRTSSLQRLHLAIYELLESLGVKYSAPQYVGNGYAPHVTHQSGAKPSANETHVAKSVYLVTAAAPEYGNPRHIVAKSQLLGRLGRK